MNLITPTLVVLNSDINNDVDLIKIGSHIPPVEFHLKKYILGPLLYNSLVGNANDLTCKNWTNEKTYNLDEIVIYGNVFYKSLANGNADNVPCDSAQWEVCHRFEKDCFNKLWDTGLKQYLANKVASTAVVSLSFPVGSRGAVEFSNDKTGVRSINKSNLSTVQNMYLDHAESYLTMLKDYIENNTNCTNFESATFLESCKLEPVPNSLLARFGKRKRIKIRR